MLPNLHILGDFMQIREDLDPKISKVARDNPKHLILLQIADWGENTSLMAYILPEERRD
jgi:hypothetical protein